MSISPAFDSCGLRERKSRQGVALVVTLALVVIVSLVIIAFVTVIRLDGTSTASYSQKLKADQLGRGALQLIIGELQNEMGKDSPPDLTYPARPLYTNVTSANILPQAIGTNSSMPSLIKISTNAPFFNGTNAAGTVMLGLIGSTNSSTTPSYNGRSVSINIWNQAFMGTYPNNGSAPYWIMMTRAGATNAVGLPFGATTANSVNNPTVANTNYVVGRIAYAVYDEGGLLDINVAGYPTNGAAGALSASQIQSIKGTLAGANLATLGIDPNALTAWRNQTSAANATTYTNYVSSFASTNGFQKVYPGDTTFVSRQDLIQAAQNGTAGLTTNVLPNLATFTRERNAPSWRPLSTVGSPTGCTVDYAGTATSASSTNVFIPSVRYTAAKTITSYRIDGTSFTYPVVAGDPLVYRRFPLDRLKWIGPNGPQNGGTVASIQACFGLKWAASQYTSAVAGYTLPNPSAFNVWQYVGPTGSTEQSKIETLSQVLAESTAREPNFFELLQAGILTGSLGMEGQISQAPSTYTAAQLAVFIQGFSWGTIHEKSLTLQVFRIGASIITQYDSSGCPALLEYLQSGTPWQATGVANLPYLNMLHTLAGTDSSTPNALQVDMVLGLWNPHQGTVASRPPVRVRMNGAVTLLNCYDTVTPNTNYPTATAYPGWQNSPNPGVKYYGVNYPGYTRNLNVTSLLATTAGSGVNGFVDPHAILTKDLDSTALTPAPATDGTTKTWEAIPVTSTPPPASTSYAGYRLPDFLYNPYAPMVGTGVVPSASPDIYWQELQFGVNTDTAPVNLFNCWLEYQNPAGNWIPYCYHAGINDPATWFTKSPGFYAAAMNTSSSGHVGINGNLAATAAMDAPAPNWIYYIKNIWETGSPCSLRFNYSQHQTANSVPQWSTYLNSSIWSEKTDQTNYSVYGRSTSQGSQYLFSTLGKWVPASLCRNNSALTQPGTPGGITVYASYNDPDGVQRISDSGLFPALRAGGPATYPQSSNAWQGDPYALSTTRTADRPIILNRPFYSVGELGYVDRDDPWRTLDFFTANSADAALLDLFTVSQSDTAVVAGRLNLNTQNKVALSAVLNNTISDVVGTTPTPTSSTLSKPAQIATDMAAYTVPGSSTGTPLLGRDQIATRLVNSLTATDFTVTSSNQDEQFVKARREGVTRALADVGQTRTWNLMIDIVAQAGRYPPTATSLNDFVVEGERHFWLHVAIDRFTGLVIDQQLETVTQ